MTMLAPVVPALHVPASLAYRLVPASEAHLDAMTAIYREQVVNGLGTWEDPIPDRAEIARRLAAVRAAGLPAWVALDEQGQVLGFSWARPFRERAAYRETVEDSIYVARQARRRGVGRGLLEAVIDACAAQGYRHMIAVVGDARNHASIGLHESLGFVAVGYLPGIGSKPGERVDVVFLQRELAGSAMPPAGTA